MSRKDSVKYVDNSAKAEYRFKIWNALTKGFRSKRFALILTEGKAMETKHIVENYGFKGEQVAVVNCSSGITGSHGIYAKRYGISGYTVFTSWLSNIAMVNPDRFAKIKGKVTHANLDFCGNLTFTSPRCVPHQFESFLKSGALAKKARVAVTYLKNREDGAHNIRSLVETCFGESDWREFALRKIVEKHFEVTKTFQGDYMNGSTPMGWVVYEIKQR